MRLFLRIQTDIYSGPFSRGCFSEFKRIFTLAPFPYQQRMISQMIDSVIAAHQ
jgi:hypothetical protein